MRLALNTAVLIGVISAVPSIHAVAVAKATSKPKPAQTSGKLEPRLYDFKGVPLEIALQDFRKLPHPDGRPAATVCTGEKIGDSYSHEPVDVMVFDDVEKSLGIVKCIWVSEGETETYLNGMNSGLSIVDSGYATNTYSYSFIRDPKDGVMRMYEFEGQTNIAAFDAAVDALTHKYGKPLVTTGTVHNKLGTAFEQTTALWANPLSSLTVQSRWSKTDDMGILLLDERLYGIVKAARQAKKDSIKNPI